MTSSPVAAPGLRLAPAPRRRSSRPETPPQPRSYSPNGEIGRRLAEAQRLQAEIQRLEALLAPHREFFLRHCQRNNLSRLDTPGFQVQRKKRNNWTYSVSTQNEMLALQQLQRFEQRNGVASNSPTEYVSFVFKQQ